MNKNEKYIQKVINDGLLRCAIRPWHRYMVGMENMMDNNVKDAQKILNETVKPDKNTAMLFIWNGSSWVGFKYTTVILVVCLIIALSYVPGAVWGE